MPTQGTPEQIVGNTLTNEALAHRVEMIAYNRRAFRKAEADAFLHEAARRLRWKVVK